MIIVVLVVFAVTAAVPMQQVKFVEAQEEERSGFGISVEMPPTNTLEETEEWFIEAEKIVESKKDELDLDGWWSVHECSSAGWAWPRWRSRPRRAALRPR